MPIVPGMIGVIASAFGFIPPLGLNQWSITGFHQVFEWSHVKYSLGLTIYTALVSSYLACLITFSILQASWHQPVWRRIERWLSPLLAMPHVSFAIGFTFLFAPTGVGPRLLHELFSDIAHSQNQHSVTLLIQDPYALGLIVMLVMKEVPFLLLMSIPILQQFKTAQLKRSCAALGYSEQAVWLKCILPQ